MANGDKLYFNGVNALTGQYALPPMTREELAERYILGAPEPENIKELKWRFWQKKQKALGVKEGVDATKLGEAGWGILFADQDREWVPAIMDALEDLLNLRREQAGYRYREYTGSDALKAGESKTQWLARHGAGPGPVDPDKVPYYLLLVGDPEAIPYQFQYLLDVAYAVGRIRFDTLEEYAQYARSVVMVERCKTACLPRRATLFNVHNIDDLATALSDEFLITPLAAKLAAADLGWAVETIPPAEADKARLVQLIGRDETPSLLFTASHGVGFSVEPTDNVRQLRQRQEHQLRNQGALLCGGWRPPPVQTKQEIPRQYYLAADDVGNDARLLGLVSFHFACYSAGTPQFDDFAHAAPAERTALAPRAFVARLPQRLLGHPNGGALAVIGHIERGFPCSFQWDEAGSQIAAFEGALVRMMKGVPVGLALEYLSERYSELSTVLSEELGDIKFGKTPDYPELTTMWMANNDARNFVVVGDPAVRLPLANDAVTKERLIIAPVEIRGPAGPPVFPPLESESPSEGEGAEPKGVRSLVSWAIARIRKLLNR